MYYYGYMDFGYDEIYDEVGRSCIYSTPSLEIGQEQYSKSGNIVILAGEPGERKLQLKQLAGINGEGFDIDKLATCMIDSNYFRSVLKREENLDINKDSMMDPAFKQKLHEILDKRDTKKRLYDTLDYIAKLEVQKPNLIFDLTLYYLEEMYFLHDVIEVFGYDFKKVHLIWLLNPLEYCQKQNLRNGKIIDEFFVKIIHENISRHLFDILRMDDPILTKYLDGDIWISFNQTYADNQVGKESIGGGFCYQKGDLFKIKSAGEPVKFPEVAGQDLLERIYTYTQDTNWKRYYRTDGRFI